MTPYSSITQHLYDKVCMWRTPIVDESQLLNRIGAMAQSVVIARIGALFISVTAAADFILHVGIAGIGGTASLLAYAIAYIVFRVLEGQFVEIRVLFPGEMWDHLAHARLLLKVILVGSICGVVNPNLLHQVMMPLPLVPMKFGCIYDESIHYELRKRPGDEIEICQKIASATEAALRALDNDGKLPLYRE